MKRILTSIIAATLIASAGYAFVLCVQQPPPEWLEQWRTISGAIPGSNITNVNEQNGSWNFSSTVNSPALGTRIFSGQSRCSSTASGDGGNVQCATVASGSGGTCRASDPSTANGGNCWCRMTVPTLGSFWVFRYVWSSAGNCASLCAGNCSTNVRNTSTFRAAVLAVP